ncbi:hypothetical protein GCM10010429_40440 [Micromonospora olivasterospora]
MASYYRRSLQVADELRARTVAFPAIATGVYGFPPDEAARIAVDTVRSTPTAVTRIFVGPSVRTTSWPSSRRPTDETATAVLLHLGGAGNVRTATLRAFGREDAPATVVTSPGYRGGERMLTGSRARCETPST